MPPWPIRIAVAWCTKQPMGVLGLVIFGRDVIFVVVTLRPGVALDQVEGPGFYLYGILDTKAGQFRSWILPVSCKAASGRVKRSSGLLGAEERSQLRLPVLRTEPSGSSTHTYQNEYIYF